jgi:hypothetical protein
MVYDKGETADFVFYGLSGFFWDFWDFFGIFKIQKSNRMFS